MKNEELRIENEELRIENEELPLAKAQRRKDAKIFRKVAMLFFSSLLPEE